MRSRSSYLIIQSYIVPRGEIKTFKHPQAQLKLRLYTSLTSHTFRCHQQDNNKPLSSASTPASETASPSYLSHEFSSSEHLFHSISRPSHLLTRSTTGFPRQRRDRHQSYAESDAARYLSQFASLPSQQGSRTRRRPLASRSATSISTMGTASTMASMTTSSAPSLIHTPASSLGASAPVSPIRKLSTFSLFNHPSPSSSSYFANAVTPTFNTRSIDLVTPVLLPSGEGSTPTSVPTIKLEAEAQDEPVCKPDDDGRMCKASRSSDLIHNYIPMAAATSMPAFSSTSTRRDLSPFVRTPSEELVYSKRATPQKQVPVEGSLKQLLTANRAQMSL